MSQIPSFNALDSAPSSPTASRFNEMSSEEFVQIIFAELSNQDPFQPNDSAALLEQLNSIRSIESDLQLMNQIESLVTENQMASAASMLDKFVGGLTPGNERVAGYVISVIRLGDEVNLELDSGHIIPFENVETVVANSLLDDGSQAPPVPPPADGDNSDDGDDGDDSGPAPTLEGIEDAWGTSDPDNDLNGDGVVDIQDLLEFLEGQG